MRHYSHAYDDRYRQVHGLGLAWASLEPTAIVSDVIARFHVSRKSKLLEVGCGEGRDAVSLLKERYDLLATDLSGEAIGWCRKAFPQYADHFQVLDCLNGQMEEQFDFLYAVAVLHMLVEDSDRAAFYCFFREHLTADGIGLICTMGDGELEMASDTSKAFELQQRTHQETGRTMAIAATSCRMVSLETFRRELKEQGLKILELGLTEALPDFSDLIYAVVKKEF